MLVLFPLVPTSHAISDVTEARRYAQLNTYTQHLNLQEMSPFLLQLSHEEFLGNDSAVELFDHEAHVARMLQISHSLKHMQ